MQISSDTAVGINYCVCWSLQIFRTQYDLTVVAEIGFGFLYFDYYARTAAEEALSQIDVSA
jgi:hypothetical protein